MHRIRGSKRLLAAGLAGVALAAAGTAFATTRGDGQGADGALADVAGRLGVAETDLRAAFRDEALERLDEAVAEGRMSDELAARIRERIEDGRPPLRLPHRDHGGPGLVFGGIVETAAEYVELPPAEVLERLRGGETLGEIAEQQGKTAQGLEDALLAEAQERIHRLVSEGLPLPAHAP